MTKKIALFLVLTITLALSSYTSLLRLDFSGFNGLYISHSEMKSNIHWITNISDTGYYKISLNHQILSEGTTAYGKTHRVELQQGIPNDYRLVFGGKKTGNYVMNIHTPKQQEKSTFTNVDSIYVLGDVHGQFDNLVAILKNSKIIDDNLHWTGGKSHLVFLGDLFDRGKKVTKVLWFIYQLEQEAKSMGGKVHVVLGNHEIMVMGKDLRYVSAKERGIAVAHKTSYDQLFHPNNSVLGNWLKHKTSVLQIDDILFAHGGIIDFNFNNLKNFNSKALGYMNKTKIFLDLVRDTPNTKNYSFDTWKEMRTFFYGTKSPYWYRGYVRSDTLERKLNETLRKFNAQIHVVAHTPLAAISKKYEGKLIATDLLKPATEILFMKKKENKWINTTLNLQGIESPL